MSEISVDAIQNEQPTGNVSVNYKPLNPILRLMILVACAFILLMSLFSIWAWCSFGSLPLGYAYLQGYRVYPVHRKISLPDTTMGEMVKMSFDLRNLTGKDIQILGAKPDCGCITTSNFPVTLTANGTQTLDFEFHAGSVGKNQHLIVTYFDTSNPPLALIAKVNVSEK